jgi:hypothetical protein
MSNRSLGPTIQPRARILLKALLDYDPDTDRDRFDGIRRASLEKKQRSRGGYDQNQKLTFRVSSLNNKTGRRVEATVYSLAKLTGIVGERELTDEEVKDAIRCQEQFEIIEQSVVKGKTERTLTLKYKDKREILARFEQKCQDWNAQNEAKSSKDPSMKKILLLASSPVNGARLRLDQEIREISEGLRRANKRDQFKFEHRGAIRTDDLRRALLDIEPQIVHFSGHGAGDDGIVVEDDNGKSKLVTTEALSSLFKLCEDHVECVLLNACYSEIQADAIAQHIDYVIGMSQAIGDRAAIKFAMGFYDALGAGKSVETAYKFGCNAIQLENIPEHLTPQIKRKFHS